MSSASPADYYVQSTGKSECSVRLHKTFLKIRLINTFAWPRPGFMPSKMLKTFFVESALLL